MSWFVLLSCVAVTFSICFLNIWFVVTVLQEAVGLYLDRHWVAGCTLRNIQFVLICVVCDSVPDVARLRLLSADYAVQLHHVCAHAHDQRAHYERTKLQAAKVRFLFCVRYN